MATSKEKIKAFFNNEQKINSLACDENFIIKVSNGNATPETYKAKFKSLGLNLTPKEAKQIAKSTKKLLSTPIEKLEDTSLKSVSGGDNPWLGLSGAGIACVSILSGVSCGIASIVSHYRGRYKRLHGDIESAEKFEKAGRILGDVAFGAGVAGTAIGIGMFALGMRENNIKSPSPEKLKQD